MLYCESYSSLFLCDDLNTMNTKILQSPIFRTGQERDTPPVGPEVRMLAALALIV